MLGIPPDTFCQEVSFTVSEFPHHGVSTMCLAVGWDGVKGEEGGVLGVWLGVWGEGGGELGPGGGGGGLVVLIHPVKASSYTPFRSLLANHTALRFPKLSVQCAKR